MVLITIRKITCFTTLGLLLFNGFLSGQTYRFRNYSTDSKLPDTFIYTLNQDNNGFLWAGTAKGLVKFDGFDFYNVAFPDSIENRYAVVSIKDSNGKLWFGCSDGSVFYTGDNKLIKLPDLNIQGINDIFEGKDGYIYIIPQDKLILKINESNVSEIEKLYLSFNLIATATSKDLIMTSACLTPSGNILLGTRENLLYCKLDKDSVSLVSKVDGIEYTRVQAIRSVKDGNKFIVGTEGNGLYMLQISGNSKIISRFPGHPEFESLEVKNIYEDFQGDLWIATFGSGAFQIKLSDDGNSAESVLPFNSRFGLPSDNVKTVFKDIEGNIWLGFYGDGLSLLTSFAFGHYTIGNNQATNSIIYINKVSNKYFLGTPKGYCYFDLITGKSEPFVDLSNLTGKKDISSFILGKDNYLWIATLGAGLFLKTPNGQTAQFYKSGNTGEDNINNIETDGKYIWLSTVNGILVIDKVSRSVKKKFAIEDRLPHNSINQVFFTKDGTALVATECDRLFSIDLNSGVKTGNAVIPGSSKNKIQCFSQSKDGTIWAGTYGKGVFSILNDSVTNYTASSNLLMSNYCYSIHADSNNKVWVGHEGGFSRYDINTGIVKVFGTDFAKSGSCNPNAIFESSDGKILIGTTEGLIVYDESRDVKTEIPPFSNILSVTINDIKYPYQRAYTLPYNKYKVKVEFVGISFNNPEKVYYHTKLVNWDNDWTKWNLEREVSYNLRDGKYKFNLIAVGEDGLSDEVPVYFELIIKKPYWRSWWFILAAITTGAGAIVIIISEREKSQRKIKKYLESELAERTRVVLKQKEEIEMQNIEITDSINYAKRIQSSILPDVNKLKDTFKDAFIVFHPRDIVSGDFYWFDKLESDKYIIVCADSTGHGVPGAFMSIIGSTLLQDIVSRQKITKPSEILSMLDKQIFSTLNQNIDIGISNDGMDMIVCEFDSKKRHIKFASAMRPVIIVMDGQPYYIKGNRYSVGGESVVEKYFDDQEYYLSEGDTVYMFSDGLPDQFGGSDGKKMKIARLKKLIERVAKLPMIEQKEEISNYFFDWKGDYEQVDDILLMGVRV